MTLNEFKEEVIDELTISCSLPFRLPDRSLNRLIRKAKKWFYKNFEDAVEHEYVILTQKIFSSNEFKKSREICLSEKVTQVFDLQEANGDSLSLLDSSSLIDSDFDIERVIHYDTYFGTIGTENLVHLLMKEYWLDTAKHILLHPISYRFNRLTHKLKIVGETPNTDVVLQCETQIDDRSLFDEEIFLRYVIATAKIEMGRIFGTFEYPMPGNVNISFDIIKSEGEQELVEIKEEIKTDEGTDYFFLTTR